MSGFYKSNYSDADGNKKVMASTQFEALDARRLEAYININININIDINIETVVNSSVLN